MLAMSLDSFIKWLEATPWAAAVRESSNLFPLIESLHVIAITIVFGTIAIVDLRLLGVVTLERRVSRLTAQMLPCTWIAFACAAITGTLLFSSNASAYAHNAFFLRKLVLMSIAGLNMLLFHWAGARGIEQHDADERLHWQARAAGMVSLLVWTGVVICGRWIGFTMF